MALTYNLLRNGYFPDELPPCFSTLSFAAGVAANLNALPPGFQNPPTAKLCSFSLARPGGLRRRLSIPNPINQYLLCSLVEANWQHLQMHAATSPFSLSNPVVVVGPGRAVARRVHPSQVHAHRAEKRAHARYILRADITEFYHSIYTHSIPWAIHTKAQAKVNRSNSLFGNQLDQLIRDAQDGQTIGIPIGPDTSLIVAETLLSSMDKALNQRNPAILGIRYLDDFEFSFRTKGNAEQGLADLQEELLVYELRLNPRKTEILDVPQEYDPSWIHELRRVAFRTNAATQAYDLVEYFDTLTTCVRKFPHEHVTKYAFARLEKIGVQPGTWDLFEYLLCQAVLAEPNAIKEFLGALIGCHATGHAINLNLLQETLDSIVQDHCTLGHDYEVAWAMWGLLAFNLPISNAAAGALSKTGNSVVAILALDAAVRGLVPPGLNTAEWQAKMTSRELYEDQWLLAYEANVQNWLPSSGGSDHVLADQSFGFLKNLGVSFYTPVTGPVSLSRPKVPFWTPYGP